MNYIEWAKEYQTEADKLQGKLSKLRLELNKKLSHRYDGILDLKQRIAILYSMYLDCRHTANLLAERGNDNHGKKLGA